MIFFLTVHFLTVTEKKEKISTIEFPNTFIVNAAEILVKRQIA
jgi:hypothetical protein